MGMFSFLKDKSAAGTAEAVDPATSTDATSANAVPVNAVPTTTTPTDSTFMRPAAWDTPSLAPAVPATPAPTPVDAASSDAPNVGPLDGPTTAELQQPIIDAIKTVFDPEIPVDIYELGLIYDIIVDANKNVQINMTLTSPACPSAQQIPNEVRWKVKAVSGVNDAWVDIAWEPAWTKDRMSEAAKLQLGFF